MKEHPPRCPKKERPATPTPPEEEDSSIPSAAVDVNDLKSGLDSEEEDFNLDAAQVWAEKDQPGTPSESLDENEEEDPNLEDYKVEEEQKKTDYKKITRPQDLVKELDKKEEEDIF